ncbi:MAG: aldo/keto reductase [Candidatus Sulfotelmatobacter sp.]
MPLNNGAGHMPALGFGTLIPDAALTRTATRDALDAGFRHFDCAERYRNEREVGDALQAGLAANGIARENIFVTTKLWNSNHRPERVEPAFEASLHRLSIKYLDLYLPKELSSPAPASQSATISPICTSSRTKGRFTGWRVTVSGFVTNVLNCAEPA